MWADAVLDDLDIRSTRHNGMWRDEGALPRETGKF